MDNSLLVAPAWISGPDFVSTAGDEVADLGISCGFDPDPEQRLALRMMYAETAPGASFRSRDPKWVAMELAIIAARQNIKTGLFKQSVLGDLFLLDAMLITWTAHLFKTAREAFIDFKNLIEANPFLSRRVKRITEGAGNEGIELMNGARLSFMARSKTGGRGITGDKIVLDEAFALTDDHMSSLMPTLSAVPNPMILYGSSAGLVDSAYLRSLRERGRNNDRTLHYLEWASTADCLDPKCMHFPDTPGCVGDDEDEWLKANPALGRRISYDYVRKERRALPPAIFMRERLGRWDDPVTGQVIKLGQWQRLVREDSGIVGSVAVFADVALDRSFGVVAICGASDSGVPQIELAAVRQGTGWIMDVIGGIIKHDGVVAVGARAAGPVASFLPELIGLCEAERVPFVKVGAADFAGMCGQFYDAVREEELIHLQDELLDDTLRAAKKHQVLDSWSWERTKVDKDAAPLVAVTGAYSLFLRYSSDVPDYDAADSVW